MDEQDRQKISRSCAKLIDYTDYDNLMDLCLTERILFDVMKQEIEVTCRTQLM